VDRSGRSLVADNAVGIICDRVLVDSARRSWFVDHGMPLTAEQARCAANYEGTPTDAGFLKDPRMRRFINERWTGLYLRYVATHPQYSLGEPAAAAGRLLSTDPKMGTPRILRTDAVVKMLYAGSLAVLPVIAAAGVVVGRRRQGLRAERAVSAAVVAFALAWYVGAWIGAATELGRLSVPAGIALRVGLIILAGVALGQATPARDVSLCAPSRISQTAR